MFQYYLYVTQKGDHLPVTLSASFRFYCICCYVNMTQEQDQQQTLDTIVKSTLIWPRPSGVSTSFGANLWPQSRCTDRISCYYTMVLIFVTCLLNKPMKCILQPSSLLDKLRVIVCKCWQVPLYTPSSANWDNTENKWYSSVLLLVFYTRMSILLLKRNKSF